MFHWKALLATSLVLPVVCCTGLSTSETPDGLSEQVNAKPIVVAHRGASGYLPEHTLPAYQLAMKMGADFIEPDLVMTKDGVLVARHDPYLSDSTDIAEHPEFADRKTTIVSPEGEKLIDWFVWDFTLEEIKTLRAKQARAGRDKGYDGAYEIPTFEEILRLVEAADGEVGVYPETKWPGHHAERDLDMLEPVKTALEASEARLGHPLKVYIQSFEPEILTRLNTVTDYPLVQLVFPLGWQPDGEPSVSLEYLAAYADGVGPYKSMLMDLETGEPTGYGARAQALGLEVHPWTFRNDDIAPGFETPEAEIRAILKAGATGFFTDFADTGRKTVDGLPE